MSKDSGRLSREQHDITHLPGTSTVSSAKNKNGSKPAGGSFGKRAWQSFVLIIIRVLLRAAKIRPLRGMLPLGSGLGGCGYLLSKRYRSVAFKNLKIVYEDEMDEAERRRITKAVFRNFGKVAMEFPYTAAMSPEQMRSVTHLDRADCDRIDRALAKGRGVIAFSAHLGNFELMARRFAL